MADDIPMLEPGYSTPVRRPGSAIGPFALPTQNMALQEGRPFPVSPIVIHTPPGQRTEQILTPRQQQLAQSAPSQQQANLQLSMAYKEIAYLEQRNVEMRSEAYAALQYQQREFQGAAGQYEAQSRSVHMIELNHAENQIQSHFLEVLGIAKQAAQEQHQADRQALMVQAEEIM